MDEKLVNQMNEAKMLYAIEPFLHPFFESQKQVIWQRMLGKHLQGKDDFVAEVAQLALLDEILNRCELIKQKGALAFKKMEANQGENQDE